MFRWWETLRSNATLDMLRKCHLVIHTKSQNKKEKRDIFGSFCIAVLQKLQSRISTDGRIMREVI